MDEFCAAEGAYVIPDEGDCAECRRLRKRLAQVTQELSRMQEYAFSLLTKLEAYTGGENDEWDGAP